MELYNSSGDNLSQVLSEAKENEKTFDEVGLRHQLSKRLKLHGMCPDTEPSLRSFLDASLKEYSDEVLVFSFFRTGKGSI